MRIEEQIADLFKTYLPVALPVLNLFTRMILNIFSKDIIGIARRLFSLPEDLIFISLTLEFAGIAGLIPSFTAFYRSAGYDPVTAGLTVSAILFVAAFFIHWWDKKYVQPKFQDVFISGYEIEKRIKKARRTRSNPSPGTREYVIVFSTEYIVGIFLWLIELGIAVYCLYYVSEILIS